MNDIEVVGLGALNMDYIYRVERILEDGETVIKNYVSFPGGSAANTIYGLAKLGISAGFIGAAGDDADGSLLLRDFQKAGVDTSQVRVKHGVRTGSTFCLSDEAGRRSIYILPGANNLLTMSDINPDYINQGKWLHVSSFVDDTQFRLLLDLVTKLEIPFSFSPGALFVARGLQALKPVLARTRVLFLNQEELRRLTGDDITTGAEACLDYGCQIVVVTLGKGTAVGSVEAAAYIIHAENEYIIEAAQEETESPVDTTGAGDAFAAGFLYGLLNGKELEECGWIGDIVAHFSITKMGARPGLPTLPELSERYHQLYDKSL